MISLSLAAALAVVQQPTYSHTNFDDNWRFALGHASDPIKDFGFGKTGMGYLAKAGSGEGPVSAGFGDGKWRQLNLPHDWVIELPFTEKGEGGHGFKAIGRDFPENSIGWYRKNFTIGKEQIGKRISIHFDGIYRNASVWCNGTFIKRNESGYIGFDADITNQIRYGQKNNVTVRVDATEFEGWFYEGAGIYRHTYLNIDNPVHLVKDGQFIKPVVSKDRGVVVADLEIKNDGTKEQSGMASLVLQFGTDLKIVGSTRYKVGPGETAHPQIIVSTENPRLWSIDKPNLYTASVFLAEKTKQSSAEVGDEYQTSIGFRDVKWGPNKGLTINGKYVKIQGTCNHQDAAGVGVALPDRLTYWRIEQLKKMGCNAYRTSHNPPTPELLDACDKLGMIVLDETRAFGDSEQARDQLTRLIRRDRNHPSVIFWSIGNEEFALNGSEEGERMGKSATALCHELDPTRPTTYAGNNGGEYRGINASVDIRGFNYGLGAADKYHQDHPTQPVHGSETASTTTTRGTYKDDFPNGRVSAYDGQKVGWGSGAEQWWSYAASREWFMGGFVWTGFDYRGEPTPTGWPTINSHFGIMDTCGFPKDIYYYYQAWWTNKPVMHIMPHWNWKGDEGKEKDVWVYSNADEVELSLNGKSLGRKKMPFTGHLEWKVAYEPGKLEAVGYKGGQQYAKEVVATTGDVAGVRIDADRNSIVGDGKDVAVLNFIGVDRGGLPVPTGNTKLHFEIEGPGKLIGVGNGDPTCLEPDTYAPTSFSQDLSTRWQMKKGVTLDEAKQIASSGTPASGMQDTDVWRNQGMAPNSNAVFIKKFEVDDPSKWKFLDIGAIDDDGWIYVNGNLIRMTNVWDETYQFETASLLKKGTNVIGVVCHNNGGDGGFSKGVTLSGQSLPAAWSRSLFNGYAQAIVQSTGKGTIHLKVTWEGGSTSINIESR